MSLLLEGWQRPAWLLLVLAVPLIYWWRSRSQRPRVVPTGSLELWRRVAAEERVGGRARRRIPPAWVLWLLAAWVAASVGVAEWRGRGRVLEPDRWLIVDARAAAFGPAAADDPAPMGVAFETRLERALNGVLQRFDGDALWHLFDGRRVRSLRAGEFGAYFEEQRALGPAPSAPDWSAWDRADALWVAPSSEELPEPARAGLHVLGGPELPGAVARDGERMAWYEEGTVRWQPAAPRELSLCLAPALPAWIAEFARAYATAQGLGVDEGDCGPNPVLEWRTHPLPAAGIWVANVGGTRLTVEAGTSASGPTAGSAGPGTSEANAVWPATLDDGPAAGLLRLGPGWISVAAGEWRLLRGDRAACALALGRIADRQWLPEPGLLPVAVRRAQGPGRERDPEGGPWDRSGARRHGAGRFTALAFALAAGAAWFAASRRA